MGCDTRHYPTAKVVEYLYIYRLLNNGIENLGANVCHNRVKLNTNWDNFFDARDPLIFFVLNYCNI